MKWNFIDCVPPPNQSITIDSTVGDIALGTISTPAYLGKVKLALLICRINGIANTNQAANELGPLVSQIQLRDTGLVYRDAINFVAGDLHMAGATVSTTMLEFIGSNDLSSYIGPSQTYLVRWEDADAGLDSLVLYGLQVWLRLYFG